MLPSLGLCIGFIIRFVFEIANDLKKKYINLVATLLVVVALFTLYLFSGYSTFDSSVIIASLILFVFLAPFIILAIGELFFKEKLESVINFSKTHVILLGLLCTYSLFYVGIQAPENWYLSAVIVGILIVGVGSLLMAMISLIFQRELLFLWKHINLKNFLLLFCKPRIFSMRILTLIYLIIYLGLCALVVVNADYNNVSFFEYVLLGVAVLLPLVRLFSLLPFFTVFFNFLKDFYIRYEPETKLIEIIVCSGLVVLLCLLHATSVISYVVLISLVFLLADFSSRLVRNSH